MEDFSQEMYKYRKGMKKLQKTIRNQEKMFRKKFEKLCQKLDQETQTIRNRIEREKKRKLTGDMTRIVIDDTREYVETRVAVDVVLRLNTWDNLQELDNLTIINLKKRPLTVIHNGETEQIKKFYRIKAVHGYHRQPFWKVRLMSGPRKLDILKAAKRIHQAISSTEVRGTTVTSIGENVHLIVDRLGGAVTITKEGSQITSVLAQGKGLVKLGVC